MSRRQPLLAAVLIAMAALLIATPAANAQANFIVACHAVSQGELRGKVRPKACQFVRAGLEGTDPANRLALRSLRWSDWGGKSSRGRGVYVDTSGKRRQVRVTLSSPMYCALSDWYSRVTIRTTSGRTLVSSAISTCF